MSINLLRYDDTGVTSKDDAILHEKTVGQTGIISGCVLTHLGANQVRISSGRGVYKGRDFNIVEEVLFCAMSSGGTVAGRIYVHIDLSDTVSPIELLSVASSPLPNLVDDDNFNDNFGIGDMELGTYNTTITAISGLTMTFSDVISCQNQIEELRQLVPIVVNTNTVTEAGYAADARQLNPNISGSLARKTLGKILWTNPNPTATFVAQTIVLLETIANFSKIEILYINRSTGLLKVSSILRYELFSFPNATISYRNNWNGTTYIYPSGTNFYFGDNRTYATYGNATGTVDNSLNIPIEIIGYE